MLLSEVKPGKRVKAPGDKDSVRIHRQGQGSVVVELEEAVKVNTKDGMKEFKRKKLVLWSPQTKVEVVK